MVSRREGRFAGAALALLSALLTPCLVDAQPEAPPPLFADHSVLELTLTVPLRTLINRRARRPDVDGSVTYVAADGATVALDVEVTTRGHSRLEICSFPPLRLDFRRSQVGDTLFAGQNRLKLVTLCRDASAYEQYLELEYLVYRMYSALSAYAYRARPLFMTYVDSDRNGRVTEAPAFFIEDTNGLAARNGMSAVEVPEIDRQNLEPRSLAILSLFQFMIGNTDWSVTSAAQGEDCCHNSDVLQNPDNGQFIVVPYDFDQAGFVDTSYASPNQRLRIRSVRQRLYRGYCQINDRLDDAIAVFNAARSEIEAIIDGAALDDDYRNDAASYVAEFYEIINDAELRQSEILDDCRGQIIP